MGGQDRAGLFLPTYVFTPLLLTIPGGKAKPLKAPKKANKELDDEDKAFLEKQRAGLYLSVI